MIKKSHIAMAWYGIDQSPIRGAISGENNTEDKNS
jgi:hypothetical protein